MKLAISALIKMLCGFVCVVWLIFLPAGTFAFPNGWLLVCILFAPMALLGIALLWKAPDLLRKRLETKERENTQKAVVALSAIDFVSGFVVAGLDYRYGWSEVPTACTVAAAVILLFGYGVYAEVMRENAYLSRTVKVETGQTVIDTGLYGIVRHPMYAATLLIFLALPIVLGSWYALIVFLLYPVIIVVRILNEEKVLAKELVGYDAYRKKVRFRLIPFVW